MFFIPFLRLIVLFLSQKINNVVIFEFNTTTAVCQIRTNCGGKYKFLFWALDHLPESGFNC